MPDLESQLQEDRMLRDAARALVLADIAHVKREVGAGEEEGGPDMSSRARDLADDARDYVSGHRFQVGTVVAALVAAVVLWLLREPIAAIVRNVLESDGEVDADTEQVGDEDRSANEPEIPAETQA